MSKHTSGSDTDSKYTVYYKVTANGESIPPSTPTPQEDNTMDICNLCYACTEIADCLHRDYPCEDCQAIEAYTQQKADAAVKKERLARLAAEIREGELKTELEPWRALKAQIQQEERNE